MNNFIFYHFCLLAAPLSSSFYYRPYIGRKVDIRFLAVNVDSVIQSNEYFHLPVLTFPTFRPTGEFQTVPVLFEKLHILDSQFRFQKISDNFHHDSPFVLLILLYHIWHTLASVFCKKIKKSPAQRYGWVMQYNSFLTM